MFVADWMTKQVETVGPDDGIGEALHKMQEKGIKHLPVVMDGQVRGMLSDRDVKSFSPSKATTLDIYELHYLLAKGLEDAYARTADAVIYVSATNLATVRERQPTDVREKLQLVRYGADPIELHAQPPRDGPHRPRRRSMPRSRPVVVAAARAQHRSAAPRPATRPARHRRRWPQLAASRTLRGRSRRPRPHARRRRWQPARNCFVRAAAAPPRPRLNLRDRPADRENRGDSCRRG